MLHLNMKQKAASGAETSSQKMKFIFPKDDISINIVNE